MTSDGTGASWKKTNKYKLIKAQNKQNVMGVWKLHKTKYNEKLGKTSTVSVNDKFHCFKI